MNVLHRLNDFLINKIGQRKFKNRMADAELEFTKDLMVKQGVSIPTKDFDSKALKNLIKEIRS